MQRSILSFSFITLITIILVGNVAPATISLAQIPPNDKLPAALARVGHELVALQQEYQEYRDRVGLADDGSAFVPHNRLLQVQKGKVLIHAAAESDTVSLRHDLEALGFTGTAVFGRMVSGWLSVEAIDEAAALGSLRLARPSIALPRVGRTTSQGDRAMRADTARQILGGISGRGTKVGVLSDSYNCLNGAANDINGGDLPSDLQVLAEESGCASGTDEGRAMLQIVHDVAPGAKLAFHTAFDGAADFAQGVIDLADAGAQVIVDDILYLDEPMFQDGPIAQAVEQVTKRGVTYVSAAGNSGALSYESDFRAGPRVEVPGFSVPLLAHDFDPGSGVDTLQRVTILPGHALQLALQWDEPFFSVSGAPGTQNDVDVAILSTDGRLLATGRDDNIGGDAYEFVGFVNFSPVPLSVDILIGVFDGANPSRIKYVLFDRGVTINEYATASSTNYGHSTAASAVAVGAADYRLTPPFGIAPPQLRDYSARGGISIRLEPNGTRKATPELRRKPEVVGPDGANTTFFPADAPLEDVDEDSDGFPNFAGTSASSPHIAAVAALVREADPSLSRDQVVTALLSSTVDMGPAGFDFDTGYGYVLADVAVENVLTDLVLTGTASLSPSLAGGTPLRYTLSASNQRLGVARETVLTATLSSEVELLSAQASNGAPCSVSSASVVCRLGALPGQTKVDITITMTPLALGTLSVESVITTSARDTQVSNNRFVDSTSVMLPATFADLQVRLTSSSPLTQTSPLLFKIGAPLTYTVQASTLDSREAGSLTVTLALPPSFIVSRIVAEGWSCQEATWFVTCTRPSGVNSLPPISVAGTVPPISNLVAITQVRAATFDPQRGNNRATTSDRVIGVQDIALPLVGR